MGVAPNSNFYLYLVDGRYRDGSTQNENEFETPIKNGDIIEAHRSNMIASGWDTMPSVLHEIDADLIGSVSIRFVDTD